MGNNIDIVRRKNIYQLLLAGCIIVSCSLCFSNNKPVIEWQSLPEMPQGAHGQLVLSYADTVIVAGGTFWENGRKQWISQSYRLNNLTSKWDKFKVLPTPYAYGAGSCYKGRFVISGGNTAGKKAIRNTAIINLQKNNAKWNTTGYLTNALIYPGIAESASRLYAFGGLTVAENWQHTSAGLRYLDLESPQKGWRNLKSLPAEGRALSGMCAAGLKLYIFGGARLNANGKIINLAESWCFDIKKETWSRLPDIPVPIRASLVLAWKKWIIIFASCLTKPDGTTMITNKMFLYNTLNKRWYDYGKAPYSAGVNGTIQGNNIYLIGGEDKARSRVATCVLGSIKMLNAKKEQTK